MSLFFDQAARLMRDKWDSAQDLAEELYAMFTSKVPLVSDVPLSFLAQPPGVPTLSIKRADGDPTSAIAVTRGNDPTQTITFGGQVFAGNGDINQTFGDQNFSQGPVGDAIPFTPDPLFLPGDGGELYPPGGDGSGFGGLGGYGGAGGNGFGGTGTGKAGKAGKNGDPGLTGPAGATGPAGPAGTGSGPGEYQFLITTGTAGLGQILFDDLGGFVEVGDTDNTGLLVSSFFGAITLCSGLGGPAPWVLMLIRTNLTDVTAAVLHFDSSTAHGTKFVLVVFTNNLDTNVAGTTAYVRFQLIHDPTS